MTLSVPSSTLPVVPGAHNDPADFYGILLALAVIIVAIAIVRLVFRPRPRRPSAGPGPSAEREEPPGRSTS